MSIGTGVFGEVATRLLVVKDRFRTWRYRILSVALWNICVVIIAADYARARWQLHLWEPDHWTYLKTMWMDPRAGRAGFSNDFMIAATVTAVTMLAGTIAWPFVKSEEFFEALLDKLKTSQTPPPIIPAAPAISSASSAAAQRWQRAPAVSAPPVVAASPPSPSAGTAATPGSAPTPTAAPNPTPAPVPAASPAATTPPPPAPTPAPSPASPPPAPAPVPPPPAPAPTAAPPAAEVEENPMDGYDLFLQQMDDGRGPGTSSSTLDANVAVEDNVDILANLMREAGYRVLRQVEMRESRAWHLIGLASDHVRLLLLDAIDGTWMADEPSSLAPASSWYVEGDDIEHPSPILEAAKLAEEFFDKAGALLATGGYSRASIRATVVVSAATIENALDMIDIWESLNVSVTAMGEGGPKPVLGDLTVALTNPVEPGTAEMLHGLAATFGAVVE